VLHTTLALASGPPGAVADAARRAALAAGLAVSAERGGGAREEGAPPASGPVVAESLRALEDPQRRLGACALLEGLCRAPRFVALPHADALLAVSLSFAFFIFL
jgi:hypothetical protein